MAIEFKDYYQILGVRRGASDEEIRSAFRRLARVYHPDKTGNDPGAEDRFKEINEAYEVLGDSTRRQRYDDFTGAWQSSGSRADAWRSFSMGGESAFTGGRREHYRFDGAGFSEFFEELFGRKGKSYQSRDRQPPPRETATPAEETAVDPAVDSRGDDLESDIWVTLDEVARGAVRPITMKRAVKCGVCFGLGQVNAHACEKCDGNGSLLREETYKVKVPRGVQEGAFLRVTGRGEEGVARGTPGDLYLKVHYAAHPEFRVEHGTLIHELDLAPWEAVLGAVVSVPTPDGRARIKIPAGTQSGRKLRLKEQGLPGADGKRGDLILKVKIQVPESADIRERHLWEELARESAFHPREN